MIMEISYGYKTDIGAYRQSNQDACEFVRNDYENYLAVVCDGMGGHSHGEIASRIVVESLINHFRQTNFNQLSDYEINSWMRDTISEIQNEMTNYAQIYHDTNDMGTTLVCAIIANDKVYVANVGDSRLYKLHENRIYQVTVDQNMWNSTEFRDRQELEFQGQYRRQYNENTFWKVLTSALGPTKALKIDTYVIEDTPGVYFLSTDGIHDYVENTDLLEVLSSQNKLTDQVRILIDRALENLSTDNLTGLIFIIRS